MAFYFTLPSDNILDAATLSAYFGTVNATYPLTNLQNTNLALPCKFTAAASNVRVVIKADFGSTKAIRFAAWFNLNYTSALNQFLLVSDTSSDYGTPGTRATFAVTYNGLASDSYSIDPYVGTALASATARQYWYTDIETSATFNTPAIGMWWMSLTLRSLSANFRYDTHAYQRAHPAFQHRTNMDVGLSYKKGVRNEVISGVFRVTATDFAALKELYDIAGESRPFPIVPDSVGTPIVSVAAECHFVRFAPGTAFAPVFTPNAKGDTMDVPVSFVMVARGLVL